MIKIFKNLKKRDWCLVGISAIFVVIQVFLDLKLPDYMSEITMLVQTEGSQMSEILAAGGWMLLCAFGSLAMSCIVGYFAARVAASFSKTLRERIYYKTLSFSMAEMNKFSTASLITRSTNDISQLQMVIAMGLQAIIKAPIMAVWAVVKIMGKSWQWTLATAGAVVILMLVICVIIVFAVPRFKIVQKQTDNLNRITRENLTGLRVVRAYNAEDYQQDKFEAANGELTKTQLFLNRVMAVMQSGMGFIMSMLTLAIYVIGAVLISAASSGPEAMTLFSDMVVMSSYAMQVVMSFMMLSMIFIMFPRAAVSAGRINEVLETELSLKPGALMPETGKKGEIELKNVSFKYPGAEEYILKDINVTINQGETVAFIGATGSGKSTLINLIPRFYDATEGEVIIDGMNVKDYIPEALNDKLGYVPQRAVLFSGTVESNVAYGEQEGQRPNYAMVKKAVKIAQAEEFVEKMDGEYNAHIAQGGTNVSGGQRQRLSIARAVSRNPEIYIFDDTFSALDYKTDKVLRAALHEEIESATVIMVAQRIGTIKDADKIVVLDEGIMAGMGTHEELLDSCEVYREIALSQLSKEELSNVR